MPCPYRASWTGYPSQKVPTWWRLPVAAQHPVLLDVATKETMTRTGEPMAPLYFRGFRLHTIWIQQPGGDLVHQIAFPHFLGKSTLSLLEYEPEKFPQGLMHGPKMVITLRPLSDDHWNIASDLVLPLAMDTFRQWHEAKRSAQGLQGESHSFCRCCDQVTPVSHLCQVLQNQLFVGGLLYLWPCVTHQSN